MRFPQFHMSNGAWIFASAVAMAIVAPAVYAAATSVVAIGNPNGDTTALVTTTRQLQTVTTSPTNLVHAVATIPQGQCVAVYVPPPGKAIMVTQITYNLGAYPPVPSTPSANLGDFPCSTVYDAAESAAPIETESRTYPTGMAMPSVGVTNTSTGATPVQVAINGYLIPANQLPPESRPRR